MADGSEHSARAKIKRLCCRALQNAFEILRQLPRLLHRELRGRRAWPAIVAVGNKRTVAETPEIGRATHLHVRVSLQPAFFQSKTQALDQRMRLRANRADNHSRLDPLARSP